MLQAAADREGLVGRCGGQNPEIAAEDPLLVKPRRELPLSVLREIEGDCMQNFSKRL